MRDGPDPAGPHRLRLGLTEAHVEALLSWVRAGYTA